MCKQGAPERCEAKTGCTRPVYSHNETVRDKNTKNARIMCICAYHYEQITGAR